LGAVGARTVAVAEGPDLGTVGARTGAVTEGPDLGTVGARTGAATLEIVDSDVGRVKGLTGLGSGTAGGVAMGAGTTRAIADAIPDAGADAGAVDEMTGSDLDFPPVSVAAAFVLQELFSPFGLFLLCCLLGLTSSSKVGDICLGAVEVGAVPAVGLVELGAAVSSGAVGVRRLSPRVQVPGPRCADGGESWAGLDIGGFLLSISGDEK
jgi:hypothetical protein